MCGLAGNAQRLEVGQAVSVGNGEGAAGTIHYPILFTNRGDTSCYLQGFPGVAAANVGAARAARDGVGNTDDRRGPSRERAATSHARRPGSVGRPIGMSSATAVRSRRRQGSSA